MDDVDLVRVLVRLETKLDGFTSHSADLETRLRALEVRPVITSKQLASWLTSLSAVIATATGVTLLLSK